MNKDEGLLGAVCASNWNEVQLQLAFDAGVEIASNQVQWSLVDQRAALGNVGRICYANNVRILAYGTVRILVRDLYVAHASPQLCGGLLSNRYLGKPMPKPSNPALVSGHSRDTLGFEYMYSGQASPTDRTVGRLGIVSGAAGGASSGASRFMLQSEQRYRYLNDMVLQ